MKPILSRFFRSSFLAVFLLGAFPLAVTAEEVTVTTYYPSPEGQYETLETTGQTLLATSSGNVGIGLASGTTPSAKLDVAGTSDSTQLIVRANLTQSNTNPLVKFLKSDGTELSRIHSDNTYNLVMGYQPLYSNASGTYNIAIGYQPLYANTSGGQNIAMGYRALYANTSGGTNIALGGFSGSGIQGGAGNIIIGYGSFAGSSEGNGNVVVGGGSFKYSGIYNGASYNTVLGFTTGNNIQSGHFNIVIGSYIDVPTPRGDHQLTIGNLIYGTDVSSPWQGGGTATPTSVSTGNVGIGVPNPGYRLELPNTASVKGWVHANAYKTYSSIRWKEHVEPIDEALDKVQRLTGVYFDWKSNGKHDMGMIAEEVGKVVPEVVTYEKNGKDADSIDYGRLTALFVEAVKEQQKEIRSLTEANKEQQKEIDALKQAIGKK